MSPSDPGRGDVPIRRLRPIDAATTKQWSLSITDGALPAFPTQRRSGGWDIQGREAILNICCELRPLGQEIPHLVDHCVHIHAFGLALQPQAAVAKLINVNLARSIDVEQLEEHSRVLCADPQCIDVAL